MRLPGRFIHLMDLIWYWKFRLAAMLGRAKPEEPPEDPYAYVGAPKKPKLPGRRASAEAPLDY